MKEAIGEENEKNKPKTNRIFILFSSITTNNIITTSVYVFFIIVETMHFLFLPIQAGNNGEYIYKLLSEFVIEVNYFRYAIEYQEEIFIIVLFCIHALFIVSLIISAAIVAYLGGKINLKHTKLVYALSAFLSSSIVLITTALIIPMMESFIYPMLCWQEANHNPTDNQLIKCGSGIQITFTTLGAFFLICTIIIFYSFNSILLDDYWLSALPWAGENQGIHFLQGIVKVLLGIYLGFDIHGEYDLYAQVLLLFLQLFIIWKRFEVSKPYNKAVYFAKIIQECLVLFIYIYNIIVHTYTDKHYIWSFASLLFMGFCFAYFLIEKQEDIREEYLRKDWVLIKTQSEAEDYIETLCNASFKNQGTPEWKFLCSYILTMHVQRCNNKNCVCNKLTGKQLIEKDTNKIWQRNSSIKLSEMLISGKTMDNNLSVKDTNQLWLNLIEIIIEDQTQKWPNSRKIMMQLAYFECIMLKNYFKSYYWILNAELLPSTQTERYLSFRMKRVLASWIIMKESKNSGSNHIVSLLRFQKVCITFQKVLYYSSRLVIKFWTILQMPKINATELYSKGEQITIALQWVSDTFKKAVELNPDYSYNYVYYGQFLQQVLNNEDEGREWIAKAEDVVKQQRDSWVKHSGEITKSSETAILVINGNIGAVGIVERANEHVKTQLGFDVNDLVGRNISRVMPKVIGEVHDNFMMHHVRTGRGFLLGNERMVFIQTKEGYLEPVCIIANTLPGLENGLEYIGFLRRDMYKIRNEFIKVPSQYRSFKLSYIIADKNKFVLGFSKSACSLFGLSTRYVARKKGITSAPFPISKLSREFESDENEHKFEIGAEVILNVKSILEFLDYDYLKPEEEEYIRKVCEEPKRAFVMLINYNYQNIVKIKAYVIIDLSENSGSSNLDKEEKYENNQIARELGGKFATIQEQASISSENSQSSESMTSQNSITNMKKQNNMREMPTTVKNLIWMIVIFTGIIMIGVTIEFSFSYFYSNRIKEFERSESLAYKVLTHFNIATYKIMAYLNVAHKLEPEILPNISNRTVDLIWETPEFLKKLKNDQYDFEEYTTSTMDSRIRQETIFVKVNVSIINPDFTEEIEEMTLNNALYSYITKGNNIMRRTMAELYSPFWLNNFVKIMPDDRLSIIERDMFFVFKNALSVIHKSLLHAGENVFVEFTEFIENDQFVLLIFHIVLYSIYGIFGILLIPFMYKIQQNKQSLLMLFAEIPLSGIISLSSNGRKFLRKNLSHLYNQGDHDADENHSGNRIISNMAPRRDSSASPSGFKEMLEFQSKKSESNQSAFQNTTQTEKNDDETETNKIKMMLKTPSHKLKMVRLDLKVDTEENKKLLKNGAEKDYDEINKNLLSIAQKEKETELINSRKKSIKNLPVSFNYLVIVVIAIFMVPLGYYAKTLLYALVEFENYKELMSAIKIINDRWAYLSNTLTFYRSYLKSMENFHYKINGTDAFEYYHAKTLEKEYEIEKLKVHPRKSTKNIESIISSTDNSNMCEILASKQMVNYTWCGLIANGLLKEGLSKSVSYFLTRTRNQYMHIRNSNDPEKLKIVEMMEPEFINLILIFLRIYNPRYDEMSQFLSNELSSYIQTELKLFTIDFGIFLFIALVVSLVLIFYFAKKIEMEIFTSRGIIALLPEKLLKTKSATELMKTSKHLTE